MSPQDPAPPPAVAVSPVADALTARILPGLTAQVEARKAELIAAAGGWFQRKALAAAWPLLLRLLPQVTAAGVDALLTEFGGMTITELLDRVIAHRRSKGLPVNRSLSELD